MCPALEPTDGDLNVYTQTLFVPNDNIYGSSDKSRI